jgi:hypothetical protein
VRRAWAAAIVIAALMLGACGGSDRQSNERPATTPMPTFEGESLVATGAIGGTLVPDGTATCTTTTATLSGTIAAQKYSLIVTAPFADITGGTVELPPPPQLDASIKLTGSRSREWVADASHGSGRITVGMDLVSGSFEAQLVASDATVVNAIGTWSCEPNVPPSST